MMKHKATKIINATMLFRALLVLSALSMIIFVACDCHQSETRAFDGARTSLKYTSSFGDTQHGSQYASQYCSQHGLGQPSAYSQESFNSSISKTLGTTFGQTSIGTLSTLEAVSMTASNKAPGVQRFARKRVWSEPSSNVESKISHYTLLQGRQVAHRSSDLSCGAQESHSSTGHPQGMQGVATSQTFNTIDAQSLMASNTTIGDLSDLTPKMQKTLGESDMTGDSGVLDPGVPLSESFPILLLFVGGYALLRYILKQKQSHAKI